MKFTFSIKKTEIDKAYDQVVAEAVKHTAIKGFRKGQAPKDMVIKAVGESKLQQQAIEKALPDAYVAEVKKRKLSPVSFPDIRLKDGKPGETFEFEAEIAEMPEVTLGDYKKALKGTLAKENIWTPEKGDSKDTNPGLSNEAKIQKVAEVLLKEISLEVPELLVNREVQRMLSKLVDQVNQLGLKIDDYLASTKQTQESIKEQYQQTAQNSLALEFILMEIAKDEKIEVTADEINGFISGIKDEKMQQAMSTPEERSNIYGLLLKQKVMDELIKIAS